MGRGLVWRLPAAAVVVLIFGFAVTALGYFVAGRRRAGEAQVDALSAPAISGATAGAGTVALSWSSVPPPDGTGAVTYHVSRDGSAPGGNCPSSAAPATATSCTDSGLVAGTYHYTVTARWRTWSCEGESTATVTVASGPASRLVLNAAATAVTAGQTDNLTILAQDASGNTVTAYSGNKDLTFTGAGTLGSNNPTVTDNGGVARQLRDAGDHLIQRWSGQRQRRRKWRDEALQGGDRERRGQRRNDQQRQRTVDHCLIPRRRREARLHPAAQQLDRGGGICYSTPRRESGPIRERL